MICAGAKDQGNSSVTFCPLSWRDFDDFGTRDGYYELKLHLVQFYCTHPNFNLPRSHVRFPGQRGSISRRRVGIVFKVFFKQGHEFLEVVNRYENQMKYDKRFPT